MRRRFFGSRCAVGLVLALGAVACASGRSAPSASECDGGSGGAPKDGPPPEAARAPDGGVTVPAAPSDSLTADAQPPSADAPGTDLPNDVSAVDGSPAVDPSTFTCNLILGIKQTGEWFAAGFETVVDNARWEVVPIHDGHIELWADPKNAIWASKVVSPCKDGADKPDRVIFVGTNYDFVTVEEWLPRYLAVIANIQSKYPGVKRIELMTHVRAPHNVACPGNLDFKTFIKPGQDAALAMAVATMPGLVSAAPKFEVRTCADYGLKPHFAGDGAPAAGKAIGTYYLTH